MTQKFETRAIHAGQEPEPAYGTHEHLSTCLYGALEKPKLKTYRDKPFSASAASLYH